MVTFTFSVDDLARTRFAISPMWELISGLALLRDPSLASLHLPWVEQVRAAAREVDSAVPLALIAPRSYMPDFLTPPPSSPLATFEDELQLVRTTPDEQVRREMGYLLGGRKPPEILRPFIEHPRAPSPSSQRRSSSCGSERSSRTGRGCGRCWRPIWCIARAV